MHLRVKDRTSSLHHPCLKLLNQRFSVIPNGSESCLVILIFESEDVLRLAAEPLIDGRALDVE